MKLREMTQEELDERQGVVPRWPDGKPAMIAVGQLADNTPYEYNIDPSGAWLALLQWQSDESSVREYTEEYRLGNPFYQRSTAEAFTRGIGEPRTLAEWLALGFVSL